MLHVLVQFSGCMFPFGLSQDPHLFSLVPKPFCVTLLTCRVLGYTSSRFLRHTYLSAFSCDKRP